MDIHQLLQLAIDRNASDLHVVVGYAPTLRIDGELYVIPGAPVLTAEQIQQGLYAILTNEQKENLTINKEMDFGYEQNKARFRVNIYHTKDSLAAAFRYIPSEIKTIEQLSLPSTFYSLSKYNSGLVLVTGPTGEGKSTTLSSLINNINLNTNKHIITIEDPIEFVYPKAKSVISQRELHQDTHSWSIALRSALREDPDVVLVGEMRDFESTSLVLTIAETGHLVFSTLHTTSTPETINRIIDIFPSHQQQQVKTQLASVLRAVVSQRLLPRADAKGRAPAVELLFNTSAVASLIRDGKPHLIDNILQTSDELGFIYFERYLSQLFKSGIISKETAEKYALRPKDLEKYLK